VNVDRGPKVGALGDIFLLPDIQTADGGTADKFAMFFSIKLNKCYCDQKMLV